jgi:hypothetical protein
MIRRILFALWLAIASSLAGARSASAQQPVFAANNATALDSATRASLTREFGQARARGLPVEPLLAKVREGLLKRARAERIQSAVAVLARRLDSARAALGTSSNEAELVAGADALSAGADVAALRAVRAASGARDVAAPLGALAQLVASGLPSKRAAQMIVDLLARDASASQVLAFGVAVETDVGAGMPATESALFRMRQIESAINSGDLSTAATQGFGQGLNDAAQKPPVGRSGQPRRRP